MVGHRRSKHDSTCQRKRDQKLERDSREIKPELYKELLKEWEIMPRKVHHTNY